MKNLLKFGKNNMGTGKFIAYLGKIFLASIIFPEFRNFSTNFRKDVAIAENSLPLFRGTGTSVTRSQEFHCCDSGGQSLATIVSVDHEPTKQM